MDSTVEQTTERFPMAGMGHRHRAQFLVYEDSHYRGDISFAQDRISIGSSHEADLVLDHQAIAAIHATVYFLKGKAFLSNKYPNNGLRLNGNSVKEAELETQNVLDIGPFSIQVNVGQNKISKSLRQKPGPSTELASDKEPDGLELVQFEQSVGGSKAPDRYAVIIINRFDSENDRQSAAKQVAKLFKIPVSKIRPVLDKSRYTIKKNLDFPTAQRWQEALQKAGVACEIESVVARDLPIDMPYELTADSALQDDCLLSRPDRDESELETGEQARAEHRQRGNQKAGYQPHDREVLGIDEEEVDEDDLWVAPFSLKEILVDGDHQERIEHRKSLQLQVVQTVDDRVVDVCFLNKRQKYVVHTADGPILLAENKSANKSYVFFSSQDDGYLAQLGKNQVRLDLYKTDAHLYRKRQQRYRLALPETGVVVVNDGRCQYRVCQTRAMPSPKVHNTVRETTLSWRHWASSVGAHLLLVLCASLYFYFQAIAPKASEPLFVKIDPSIIKQLEARKKAPPVPKKQPPPPKPEPQPVVSKVKPAKRQTVEKKPPKPIRKVASKKRTPKPKAQAREPSRHPKAGGGHGKGNIRNRNVNQTGLLSILGSTAVSGPSEAIASVTNLDAVPVPGATQKNFSVGGVKGTLGTGKITLASSGGLVETKGGQQVLRSAGASGMGDVAALERGSTGRKQVQAMVTAQLSRKVKVDGGMSREMVKRVIDQHLEEITYCYESALIANPSIMGRVVFEWKILMSGRVGEIRIVASSINSHDIHACIKAAIKSWQFPNPVGTEVVVSYPFVFDLVAF